MNNNEVDYSRYVRREESSSAQGPHDEAASKTMSQADVREAMAAGDDVAVRKDMMREGGFSDLVKR
ncbi:MAG: hypothetical protein II217_07255, partial [Alistipes sp.]|nr:hypothetical protein [Alistipes sp.]